MPSGLLDFLPIFRDRHFRKFPHRLCPLIRGGFVSERPRGMLGAALQVPLTTELS